MPSIEELRRLPISRLVLGCQKITEIRGMPETERKEAQELITKFDRLRSTHPVTITQRVALEQDETFLKNEIADFLSLFRPKSKIL